MTIRTFSLSLLLLLLVSVVSAQLYYSGFCNNQKVPSDSPFVQTVDNLVADLVKNTPNTTPSKKAGYVYKTTNAGSGGSPTAYGEATCLLHDQCSSCQIWNLCKYAIGGRIDTQDDSGQISCSIRYEQYSF